MGDDLVVALGDGRQLDAWSSGDGATAVLLQMGTPCVGRPFEPMAAAVAARGCRLVTYSRPGYGRSTRQPGRCVADCAGDVAALARQLGLERIHVVGWSGGGPHALATAALLPELVVSAATLAGVAPPADDLDWLEGMAEENRLEFGAAFSGADELERFLVDAAAGMRARSGETIAAALGGLVTEVDRRSLSGAFADYLASVMGDAVANGIWGWFDDDLAFTRDWGFALDQIRVPVSVWQGRQDAMVPYAHGEWLARNVPGARARLFDSEGHISLVMRFGEILDELVAAR